MISVVAVTMAFIALLVWVLHPKNAERFENDGMIPLRDDDDDDE